jgi:hypothetical protein
MGGMSVTVSPEVPHAARNFRLVDFAGNYWEVALLTQAYQHYLLRSIA